MNDDMFSCLKRLSILNHSEICDHSREIYRNSLTSCPQLGISETCRTFVCVEISCIEHRHAFDREFAIRSASSTVLHYQNAYDAISRSLGLNTDRTTVRSLAIQHGCDALEEPTEYLINSFYEKYTMTLTSNQKSFISKKDPALIVAAFVLCAQAYKTRTDKKALLDRNKIKLKHYTTFTSLIKQYCVDEINDLKSGINLQKRKVNHNEHFDIRYNENTENNIDKDISVNHIASIMYFDFVKSCILGDLKLDSNWFEYNSWRKEIYRTIDSTKK